MPTLFIFSMKKCTLFLLVVLGVFFAKAQNTFSKMFDTYGHWESFMQAIEINKDSITLLGEKQNFFVSDSTRFKSLVVSTLYNGYLLRVKYLFAKDTFQNGLISYYNNDKVIITFEQDVRNNNSTYWLNKMNASFDSILSKKLLPISNKFYVLSIKRVNNKLYFFCADYTTFVASKLKLSMQCMDTNGNLLWGKVFQNKRCYTNNVVQTTDGNFLVAGLKYYGESLGGEDSAFAWYAKIDTIGNIIWERDLIRGGPFLADDLWVGKANGDFFLSGSLMSLQGILPLSLHKDSSYCTIAKISEQTGNIIWQKQLFTQKLKIQDLFSLIKQFQYHNGSLYALVDHRVSERENPQDLSQYVMLAKFDLQGNILWKRLFSNWYVSNRAFSLTPLDDGFLICGDAKDSTHEKGDSDAWLIKTDTNGCIIPGCNAKDGIAQIINPEKVFTVFPNPAQNEVNVSSQNKTLRIESLAIYNMQGTILKTVYKTEKINTEELANGNYILIITTNKQQMAVKKFVIER